ncbi:MAG TPA: SPFH domain-containing protein [Elusimicrobiota bacterium]|nr:SPFH domain-containing protein [Elusimicrobiota bacterium]
MAGSFDGEEAAKAAARVLSRLGVVVAAVAILTAFSSAYSIIAPGYTGVIFNIWTGSLRTVGQGMAMRIPWITRVQSYPTALRTYTMVQRGGEGSASEDDSLDLPTKEGQHIRQDLSVTYNTSEEKAAQVFKAFRGMDIAEIEATFIRRTIITVAQNAAGQMSLSEIISAQRGILQDKIQSDLGGELAKMGFNLDKVNLGASHLPPAIEAQMQQKMGAQQQAQQAEYELQKQQTLAKAAVAQAEGVAQATLVKAKAEAEGNRLIQTSLTQTLVNYRSIDKWNGALPQVTGGATPFIDLRAAK